MIVERINDVIASPLLRGMPNGDRPRVTPSMTEFEGFEVWEDMEYWDEIDVLKKRPGQRVYAGKQGIICAPACRSYQRELKAGYDQPSCRHTRAVLKFLGYYTIGDYLRAQR